jgi:hypothetical protein
MTSYRKINSRTINNEVNNNGNIDLFLKPVGFGRQYQMGNSVSNSSSNALLTSDGLSGIQANSKITFDGTTLNVKNAVLDVSGNFILHPNFVPTANNSAGIPGQISWDATHLYVCVGPGGVQNAWGRVDLSFNWS